MRFEERSRRAQIAVLRQHAVEVLRRYPIEVDGLRLLNHGYNTTFRVDASGGQRFALRINVNSRRAPEHLNAEIGWLAALTADTDLVVPVPQPDRDSRLIVELSNENLGPISVTERRLAT
jgi:Ser/Thr protein kinase RdoA (MazF antagonist)